MKPVSKLKNLGPISQDMLGKVGIKTAEELVDQDPVDVFILLKLFGFDVSDNMLWALYGAVNDIEITKINAKVKKQLKAKLNQVWA